MFKEEARWIRRALSQVDLKASATVLDVGASNLEFRTRIQPHIREWVHQPLLAMGCPVRCLDIKHDAGVDIVADLASADVPDAIFSTTYDLIICCNILEHVRQRELFIGNLLRFAHCGTLLLVTVPRVYPKHNDPIDTMYRPTVHQLTEFVDSYAKCTTIASEDLIINEKEYYVLKPGRKLDYLLARSARMLARWYMKPLRWRVTCALLEIKAVRAS